MSYRRKARKFAIQVLFSLDFGESPPEKAFELIYRNFDMNKKVGSFARELVSGVWRNIKEIDNIIDNASKNWKIKRMSRVDKSILRLATYELIFRNDIPPKVSINEAIELSKIFGNNNSYRFINGILDNIYNSLIKEGDKDAEKI